MKEVKTPKKPLLYYYIVALLVLLLFNFFAMPLLARQQVEEVDYGTFMTMTENKEIGEVEIESNQIIFTNKDGSKIYKTGPWTGRRSWRWTCPCRTSWSLRRRRPYPSASWP